MPHTTLYTANRWQLLAGVWLTSFALTEVSCVWAADDAAMSPKFLPRPGSRPRPRNWRTGRPTASSIRRGHRLYHGRDSRVAGAIPTEWGNWIFYYACADDGTSLEPRSLTEHRCPRCNKIFTDERTVAAYRTQLYYRADRASFDSAWAFALSDDPRHGRNAADSTGLRRFVSSIRSRRDRWGREGLLATIGGRVLPEPG